MKFVAAAFLTALLLAHIVIATWLQSCRFLVRCDDPALLCVGKMICPGPALDHTPADGGPS